MRHLNKNRNRAATRYATRMLGGARRPRERSWLGQACALYAKYIKISECVHPWLDEQVRLQKHREWVQTCERHVRAIYGS